jgi:hypothetical protein
MESNTLEFTERQKELLEIFKKADDDSLNLVDVPDSIGTMMSIVNNSFDGSITRYGKFYLKNVDKEYYKADKFKRDSIFAKKLRKLAKEFYKSLSKESITVAKKELNTLKEKDTFIFNEQEFTIVKRTDCALNVVDATGSEFIFPKTVESNASVAIVKDDLTSEKEETIESKRKRWAKGYYIVYKEFMQEGRHWSNVDTNMIGYLRDKWYMYKKKKPWTKYVYDTADKCEATTRIKKVARRNSLKKIVDAGIISAFRWDSKEEVMVPQHEASAGLLKTKLWFIWNEDKFLEVKGGSDNE